MGVCLLLTGLGKDTVLGVRKPNPDKMIARLFWPEWRSLLKNSYKIMDSFERYYQHTSKQWMVFLLCLTNSCVV